MGRRTTAFSYLQAARRIRQLLGHVASPQQDTVAGAQHGTGTDSHHATAQTEHVKPVAPHQQPSHLLTPRDQHVWMEVQEHLQAVVATLVGAVGERVALEDKISEVGKEHHAFLGVVGEPLLVNVVAEDGHGHALFFVAAEEARHSLVAFVRTVTW